MVIDDDMPIAYTGLPKGTPVVTATGYQFGMVEHVLEIPAQDLFDGIVVATDSGLRFVDRDQIDQITTARVRCLLTDQEVASLAEPDGAPVYTADPSEHAGASLHDRFGRMFGRPHWKPESSPPRADEE